MGFILGPGCVGGGLKIGLFFCLLIGGPITGGAGFKWVGGGGTYKPQVKVPGTFTYGTVIM